MKKLLILLLALLSLSTICIAQANITTIDRNSGGIGGSGPISFKSIFQGMSLPGYKNNIIPPSPGPSQMTKYVDLPITHSLGVVDITIPLYTIKCKDIEIPISLSYNASGVKVDEDAGAVGIGWTLNVGGVIAREIRGLPDDCPHAGKPKKAEEIYKIDNANNNKEIFDGQSITYLDGAIKGKYDLFYDLYRYTYPGGGSGSFMIKEGSPVKLISNDDEIIYSGISSATQQLRISAPDGTMYVYDEQETVLAYSHQELKYQSTTNPNNQFFNYKATSSWALSRITNFNSDVNVNYTYDSLPGKWNKDIVSSGLNYLNASIYAGDAKYRLRDFFTYANEEKFYTYREYSDRKTLKCIDFPGGVVLFDYYPKVHSGGALALKSITVKNNTGDLIRKINIKNSTFGDNRVKLDAVEISGSDNKIYDSYEFTYHNPNDNVAYNYRRSQDRFGYYNGKFNMNLLFKYLFYNDYQINTGATPPSDHNFGNSNVILVPEGNDNYGITSPEDIIKWKRAYYLSSGSEPTMTISPLTIGEDIGDNRDYSFYNARKYALQSIKRLSGAETKFIYGRPEKIFTDPDRHFRDTVSTGLRIDSILTYDRSNLVKIRAFKYENSGCTINFDEVFTGDYSTFSQVTGLVWQSFALNYISSPNEQHITVHENQMLPGADISSARVFYEKVTETVTGTQPGEKTVTEYNYDCSESIHKRIMVPSKINSAYKAPGAVQSYDYWKPEGRDTTARISHIVFVDSYFKENPPAFNNIVNKKVYRTDNDGALQLASEEITSYIKLNNIDKSNISDIDNQDGMFVGLYVQKCKPIEQVIDRIDMENSMAPDRISTYYLTDLSHPTDCNFFDVYQGVNTTRPRYTIRKAYNDNGTNTQRILYKYSNDVKYAAWPQQPLISDNGSVDWNDEALLAKSLTPERCKTVNQKEHIVNVNGKIYHSRYLFPANYDDSSNYNKYMPAYTSLGEELIIDGENIGGTYTQYKNISEGIRNVQPVDKVNIFKNTTTSSSKITRFDAKRNPACVVQPGEPTTCYIWGYNGMYPVAVIRNAEYNTIQSELGLNRISSITTGSSLSSFDLYTLDNLRNAPSLKNAQITTYTYKPLVGITSMTDPSGRKLCYYYDTAGRLTSIKDENMNLVETYEYKNIN